MKFEIFREKVRGWAFARGIYDYGSSTSQLLKAVSEMGELADAHAKGDGIEKLDAVGDILVCLVNYCEMEGIRPYDAMQRAWDEIKDRKGRMSPNGVFIKET